MNETQESTQHAVRALGTDAAYDGFSGFKECWQHEPPPTIKWGIASGKRWCRQCKKFIRLRIDWDGHP